MAVVLGLLGVALTWAWVTGRLKAFTLDDAIAAALFLLGGRLLTTGRILTGALVMAAALLYAGYRRGRFKHQDTIPIEDARRLLGVAPDASIADIRAAHRRLIARVHPDAGGSEELARRINAARDALIADQMRSGQRRDPAQ